MGINRPLACALLLLMAHHVSARALDSRRALFAEDSSVPVADVLNFALNLECVEGQFYSCAAFGKPLSSELTGGGPDPIGCEKANLTYYKGVAEDIAKDEVAHVAFLRKTLGSVAVKCPQVDIGPAFAAAADAAAKTKLSPPFSPYANDLFFLHGAFIFEDVGVTAYKGALPLLCSYADYLSAAGGILGVEAYHSGSIRSLLINNKDVKLPYDVTVDQFIGAISDLRDKLDGPGDDDKGIVGPDGAVILAPVDSNAIAFSRTPQQVLKIVYGGDKPGLFFPNGLNGNIK